MGIPIWGSDTGGYYEFKDREVFARWIEFSAFSGIMEIGGVGTHAPWDMPTEPRYDDEMIDIYRRYTQLRATLQPYIVAAARRGGDRAADRAADAVRRPHGPRGSRDRWDQYLFGPDLLVAPVWKVGRAAARRLLPARHVAELLGPDRRCSRAGARSPSTCRSTRSRSSCATARPCRSLSDPRHRVLPTAICQGSMATAGAGQSPIRLMSGSSGNRALDGDYVLRPSR